MSALSKPYQRINNNPGCIAERNISGRKCDKYGFLKRVPRYSNYAGRDLQFSRREYEDSLSSSVAPCSLLDVDRCSRGTFCLHRESDEFRWWQWALEMSVSLADCMVRHPRRQPSSNYVDMDVGLIIVKFTFVRKLRSSAIQNWFDYKSAVGKSVWNVSFLWWGGKNVVLKDSAEKDVRFQVLTASSMKSYGI
jgi:hypothetical protein